MLIFVVNIRPARTFWNSTHCLLSLFTLDWSRDLWHNPMWNMAVNNISYPIYPLSTRTEKGYLTKMIPFFFCSVYIWYTGYPDSIISSTILFVFFFASKELSRGRTKDALSIRSFWSFEISELSTLSNSPSGRCRNLRAFNIVEISPSWRNFERFKIADEV